MAIATWLQMENKRLEIETTQDASEREKIRSVTIRNRDDAPVRRERERSKLATVATTNNKQ